MSNNPQLAGKSKDVTVKSVTRLVELSSRLLDGQCCVLDIQLRV
jgi:hypothetical protein